MSDSQTLRQQARRETQLRSKGLAERIAIESYKEMIRCIGLRDSTTGRLLESILAKEEEHVEELSSMLRHVKPDAVVNGLR